MTENTQEWVLQNGLDVVGTDGEKVGEVQDALGDYFVVKKGWLFPTEYYIPSNAIANVDDRAVYLTVSKDEALNQGWDQVPASADTGAATTGGTDYLSQQPVQSDDYLTQRQSTDATYANDTAGATGLADTGTQNVDSRTLQDETVRVPLSEEELTATKRDVERGKVQVQKHVEEEQQSLDVPVTEERVHVERRVVDRDLGPEDADFQEGTIDVPVRGEEVDVQKRARVTGEVEVTKERVGRTEHVTDTVRRERADVTGDTDLADTAGDIADDDTNTRPIR